VLDAVVGGEIAVAQRRHRRNDAEQCDDALAEGRRSAQPADGPARRRGGEADRDDARVLER
jgi:hypothetical protein